ncbi:MAG TPA: hypothetical protein PKE40_01280 [Arachnia sp.]|nr:hypothetical protein [Arachnia sp.]HMT84960.1 hypothetical protein [Arachnia sp.]
MERHMSPASPGDGEPGLPPRRQPTSQVRRWRIDFLLCGAEPHLRSRRAGDRLLDLVAGLPQGSSVSIEARSRRRHATTPAATSPLGHADIEDILARGTTSPAPRPPAAPPSFLDEWLERRRRLAAQSQDTPVEHADAPGK